MLGFKQSLTPGRNNGFLNMLQLMQKKSLEISVAAPEAPPNSGELSSPSPASAVNDADITPSSSASVTSTSSGSSATQQRHWKQYAGTGRSQAEADQGPEALKGVEWKAP